MPTAYVSIGSNLRREYNVRSAVRTLRKRFRDLRLSPVYECKALGFRGPDFLNLVVAFEAEPGLDELCAELRDIERMHGRDNDDRDGSRTLDLDLLLYGDVIRHDDTIDVPRGEITRYAFVLQPLCDLAGDLRHPELGCTLSELWSRRPEGRETLRAVAFDPLTDDKLRA